MFVPNSKAMMDQNRSWDGNRMMNPTMSKDIYGAFDGLGALRLSRAVRPVPVPARSRFIGPTSSPNPVAVPFARRKDASGWSHAVRGNYMGEVPTAAGYGRETPGSTFWTRSTGGMYGLGEDVVETSYAQQTELGLIPGSRQWLAVEAGGGRGRQHFAGLGQDIPIDPSASVDTTSWGTDLLNIVKQALPIYQQSQIFNQQLSVAKATGQPVGVAVPAGGTIVMPPISLGKMAMIAGGGVLALILIMRVMKR